MVPLFMLIIFCLLFFYFLKFIFFSQFLQIRCSIPGVCYGTWNSLSRTLFANKHDQSIQQEAISFRLKKETSCLSNLEEYLKKICFNFQRFYIMAATTIPWAGML